MRFYLSFFFLSVLFAASLLWTGCEQQQPTEPEDPATLESFALLQKKVFDLSCATSGCHSNSSKAGGLVLEATVSYSSLVNATPTNTAASHAGLKLIRPGLPDSSLLYLKLGQNVKAEYGDRMPQNSIAGMTSSAREFIRQWIAAGAPQSGKVADYRLLESDIIAIESFNPPAPPTQGLQLHVRPFAIDPGQEREIFTFDRVTNDAPLYISGIDIAMREGSHHFILYKYGGSDLQQGIVRDFNNSTLFQEMRHSDERIFLMGAQTPTLSVRLPEGVVFQLDPNQGFDLNSHYTNNNGQSVMLGEVYVNLHTVQASPGMKVAIPIFDNYINFVLPKNEKTTVQRTVLFDSPRQIFSFSSHTHKRGESFKIFLVGGHNDGQLVYENFSWDHPPAKMFSTPLSFQAGWGYRIEVVYNNETEREIRFGFTSEDEMCIVLGYYY